MSIVETVTKKSILLGYELSPRQDALVNHLVPSLSASILYILLIAADIGVIFCHYKNGDPIWASLTLFILYVPSLGSFIIVISNWELWPEFESFSRNNIIWFWTKVGEHLFFPIWSMWRFAERIFWSIEALRAEDDKSVTDAISLITAPRSIELYIFLQSYLHALPQILLQLFILVRHNTDINRQTEKAQILSLALNLLKLSVTTAYYQRFKSQKLTGKQYPWYKYYKSVGGVPSSPEIVLRRPNFAQSRSVLEKRPNTSNLEDKYDIELPRYSAINTRRRSSDLYLEPLDLDQPLPGTSGLSNRQTLLETDFDQEVQTRVKVLDNGPDEVDAPPAYTSNSHSYRRTQHASSVPDEPRRLLLRETGTSEPDFNISRIIYTKGLEDDDLAGKLVATLWWFTFLLARVLTISIFAYFYMKETIYLITVHFLLVVGALVYDVKSDEVKRAKAAFFIFIGLVFIFCIIEFKIKFKKATIIFYGYFFLTFFENIVMCLVWYLGQIDSIENDFWFRFVFYVIVACSLLSFSTMMFYFILNKPPKVVVATNLKESKQLTRLRSP